MAIADILRDLPSKRIILSYVWDWIAIIIIAAIGGGLSFVTPNHRPFALTDLSISYPALPSQVPTWLLIVVSWVIPLIIIFFVCLIFVPGKAVNAGASKKAIWRRKAWEWHAGWIGLCLSLALNLLFISAMKNLFGRPRPDMLSRCQPDASTVAQHLVGQYAPGFNVQWALVDIGICTTTDTSHLNDGFRSFPSGHAAYSWGGLFYLALFLSSKFAIAIPYAPARLATDPHDDPILPTAQPSTDSNSRDAAATAAFTLSALPSRNRAASPPVYLLALPLIPIFTAIYITSTRFFQFDHHGTDLLAGSILGIAISWFSFRWHHMPVGAQGWAWGARSRHRAWGVGVGRGGYVGSEGWGPERRTARDVEGGVHGNGIGREDERVNGHEHIGEEGKVRVA